MRDAGCGMQDAGCGMRDAGCGIFFQSFVALLAKPAHLFFYVIFNQFPVLAF